MNTLQLFIASLLVVGLSACGGGSGGNLFGPPPQTTECNTGTAVELANPLPGQSASNVNQITIVANGNTNTLYNNYQNWYIYVSNGYSQYQGGQLNLVANPSGPHPYPSDFYYSSQFSQTLPAGNTWTVYLTQYNGGCNAVPLQNFST